MTASLKFPYVPVDFPQRQVGFHDFASFCSQVHEEDRILLRAGESSRPAEIPDHNVLIENEHPTVD